MGTELWTARVHRSLVGAVVPYVRRHKRKLVSALHAPAYVREFLNLTSRSVIEGLSFDDLTTVGIDTGDVGVRKVTLDPARSGRVMRAWITFAVKNPAYRPPRPKLTVREHGPLIRDFKGLLRFFRTDAPRDLNRHIYGGTDCGASISVYLADGTTVHNGDPRWKTLTGDEKLDSFTIQTIVEGSDATVDSDHFRLPCTQAEVTAWMADMEAEADALWREANSDDDLDNS